MRRVDGMNVKSETLLTWLKKTFTPKKLFWTAVLVYSILSTLFLVNQWKTTKDEITHRAVTLARVAANDISGEMFRQLRTDPRDVGTVAYESVKKRLVTMIEIIHEARFAYIYIRRDNKLFFTVDSEPLDSKDYLPPGQEYAEAGLVYRKPFDDGQVVVTKPETDRWGTWVSILIPMKDPSTNETVAVFGMDYPAATWNLVAMQSVMLTGVIVVVIHLVFFSLYVIIRKDEKLKKAQVGIRENEERMHAITESAQDGIIMMDPEGFITFWNPAIERILGYSSTEAIGRNLPWLMVPSRNHEAQQTAFPLFQQTGQVGEVGKTIDLHARRKDNAEITVQLSLSAVSMHDGWHSIGIVRDITQQKQAESELVSAKEIAEEAVKAKSEFLANMSHEIRTPMNAIIGFSNLILKTDMTQKQRDYLGKIDSSANALLGIINDILDFSKIEAGKLEMEAVAFRLDQVMNHIVAMISVEAAKKNIELLSTIAKGVPWDLVGDPIRLGQILINLANNAVKFTEKGHILIRAELADQTAQDCRLRFSVRDTGIGMTAEQMGKLFFAFSQGDSSVTRKYGGTGLGLTISKRLVNMMDGEIHVESEYGIGSQFVFTAVFRKAMEEKEVRTFDVERFKALKVLVVDDNETAREILKEQICAFGMSAVAVDSGEAALAELERISTVNPYDLVLMDLSMPGMDGLEATQRIIEDKKLAHTPVTIMVSAFGREEIFQKAKKMGVDAFLMKPINQSLLFDTIMQAFGVSMMDSALRVQGAENTADLPDALKGARILLVEDNALNQEVATEILKGFGVFVDIAGNGQEAVDAVNASEYDGVLMDVQMPVMGGYEATRLIRGNERFHGLPIIAMTAHAMKGVKEDCLSAGMNDYVSKPIDPKYLFATLCRWVKPVVTDGPDSKGRAGGEAAPELDQEANLPDSTAGIDIHAGVDRIGGNRRLFRKLLDDFASRDADSARKMKTALADNQLDKAYSLAHTLKGVAGNLSLTDIQAVAAELEAAVTQKDASNYAPLVEKLQRVMDTFAQMMKDLVRRETLDVSIRSAAENDGMTAKDYAAAAKPGFSVAMAEEKIWELTQLVWDDNADARNALEDLQGMMGETNFSEEMALITESIRDYDFDAAKSPLRVMAEKLKAMREGGQMDG